MTFIDSPVAACCTTSKEHNVPSCKPGNMSDWGDSSLIGLSIKISCCSMEILCAIVVSRLTTALPLTVSSMEIY